LEVIDPTQPLNVAGDATRLTLEFQQIGCGEEPAIRFAIRSDGCVEITRWFNDPGEKDEDGDYIHICDLDAFIAELQAVKAAAIAHFGRWPC
jgi:hypothetical protein